MYAAKVGDAIRDGTMPTPAVSDTVYLHRSLRIDCVWKASARMMKNCTFGKDEQFGLSLGAPPFDGRQRSSLSK